MAGFNKMFIMLPLMFATRKLDGEDPQIIFLLRCAYGTVQSIILLITIYVYKKATELAKQNTGKRIIYVPPPPQVGQFNNFFLNSCPQNSSFTIHET